MTERAERIPDPDVHVPSLIIVIEAEIEEHEEAYELVTTDGDRAAIEGRIWALDMVRDLLTLPADAGE